MNICHTRSLFKTRQGKGEHDGVRAYIKQALRYQPIHFASQLIDSIEVVNWLKKN
jgi:hypothetical protein